MNRRDLIRQGIPAAAGLCVLPALPRLNPEDDSELKTQAEMIRQLDNDAFEWLWSILNGITEEELDWKINEEANTVRWILGHLTWFEEWACDAIEETGLYLIKEQPSTSFQADTLEAMKERLTKAHEKYNSLVKDLTPEQIRRPSQYLYNDYDQKRAETDLKTILSIHCTHFFGHLYQIRMIRGTYSRVSNTDKSKFDKW